MKGPIALLQESIAIFKTNPQLFIGIYLIPGLLTLTFTLFINYEGALHMMQPVSVAIIALLWVAMMVASIFMAIAMIHAVMNPQASVLSAYQSAKPFFWRYIVLSILVSLSILVGFILLIIPAILFFVWFTFSYYVLINENISGIDAMKRSKALVSGRWWAVFGRLVALMLLGLIMGLAFGFIGSLGSMFISEVFFGIVNLVLNAILAPISVAYLYLLYKDLLQTSATEPASQDILETPETANSIQAETY